MATSKGRSKGHDDQPEGTPKDVADVAGSPKVKAKKTSTKRSNTDATTDRPNALQTPVEVSDELEVLIGKGPMSRGQVTSKVWDYIKAHKLQAPEDGRTINPDKKLGKVIGTEPISMFKMTAAISKHIK